MRRVKYGALLGVFTLMAIAQDVYEQVNVNLVELDVRVTDWRARYITGLTAGDFSVIENGKTQTIDSFEEIDLNNLDYEQRLHDKSRIMLVVDVMNSEGPVMSRVIEQLENYALDMNAGVTELGLAVNYGSIREVVPFTNNPDKIMAGIEQIHQLATRSEYRTNDPSKRNETEKTRHILPGYGELTGDSKVTSAEMYARALAANAIISPDFQQNASIQRVQTPGFQLEQLEILEQFINFLGAYTGKKTLVMISQSWNKILDEDEMRDIVTTCLRHKISINMIGFTRDRSTAEYRHTMTAEDSIGKLGQRPGLAASTGGFFFSGTESAVGDRLDRAIRGTERFYRIRYYSDSSSKKFRKVKVKVHGKRMEVHSFNGYHPQVRNLPPEKVNAKLALSKLDDAGLNLSLDTDWFKWSRLNRKVRYALYAIGMRGYNDMGQLVGEKVLPGRLISEKQRGSFQFDPLVKDYRLNLQDMGIQRIEFVVVDLSTGKKVTLDAAQRILM